MTATAKFKTFEIRPCNNSLTRYEIVKWTDTTGSPHCYVIAFVNWNEREPCWEMNSVGLRFVSSYEAGLSKFVSDFFELLKDPHIDKENRGELDE